MPGKAEVEAAAAALPQVPCLVIGAGLDRYFPEPDSERLAEWLGADYQPYGAHSHYGLVVGEESYEQVAEAMRSFLERLKETGMDRNDAVHSQAIETRRYLRGHPMAMDVPPCKPVTQEARPLLLRQFLPEPLG